MITKDFKDKVTLIKNHRRNGILKNIHDAITNFCTNPFSIIIILDADDMIIGNSTLSLVHRHYIRGADATVGTPIRMDKGYYIYEPDFTHPRNPRGGDVWMHLRTFYKYLFDSVPMENFLKSGRWLDKFSELSYMVPIIEMANHPVHVSVPTYLWEPTHVRDDDHYRKNKEIIAHIMSINTCSKLEYQANGVSPPGILLNEIHPNQVTFIRHAERIIHQADKTRDDNITDDVALTLDGVSDCLAWGERLPFKLDLIIASPADRTVQTAENIRIANGSSCELITLDCLRGVKVKDRKKWKCLKESKSWNILISDWCDGKLDASIIDPFETVMDRIVASIRTEIMRRGSKNVLVISHDHMVNVLYYYITGAQAGRAGYLYGFSVDNNALKTMSNNSIKVGTGGLLGSI
jgi:broad specificity phosphatase PhoE